MIDVVPILFRAPVETRWGWLNWPAQARWAVTLSFLTLVNVLLLSPAAAFKSIHVFFAHQDKIAHGLIFLTLALLVRWSLPGECGRGRPRLALIASLALYAGSIEVFQPFLAGYGRTFEWLDLVSNFAGVSAGWLFFGVAVATRLKCDE